MLRSDFEVSGNMIADQFIQQFRLTQGKVKTDAGVDENVLDFWVFTQFPQQVSDRQTVAMIIGTGFGLRRTSR